MAAPDNTVFQDGVTVATSARLNTFLQGALTVATLRQFIGTAGMTVYLQGVSVPNDGGQGMFYWVPTATGPDDGYDIIMPYGAVIGAWVRFSTGSGTLTPTIIWGETGTLQGIIGLNVIRRIVPAAGTILAPSNPVAGVTWEVKDGAGNSATYPITISGNGNDIDGQSTLLLNVGYAAYAMTFDGTEWDVV